jgi:hypothetical protein
VRRWAGEETLAYGFYRDHGRLPVCIVDIPFVLIVPDTLFYLSRSNFLPAIPQPMVIWFKAAMERMHETLGAYA